MSLVTGVGRRAEWTRPATQPLIPAAHAADVHHQRRQPARSDRFHAPVTPGWSSEPFLGVRLEYSGLSASWPIDGIDGPAFARFFTELARRREENLEGLAVHSSQTDLTLSAEPAWQAAFIDLAFKLSCDIQDPYWTTELRVAVPKDQLDQLAADAGAFFEMIGAG